MRDLFIKISGFYDRFFDLVSTLKSPFLLFVRLYWGWQLIESGWGKLHNLPKVIDFFASLGLFHFLPGVFWWNLPGRGIAHTSDSIGPDH
jgi:uncharacterized membrane protein YphA (DoxX/SURF4 family)